MTMAWALEAAPNPTVLRLHVTEELTAATIVTCPPAEAPAPLDLLLRIAGIRSLDLHRYRVRLNLVRGSHRNEVRDRAQETLRGAWGDPRALVDEETPRAFAVPHPGPRRVAESLEMAAGDATLTSLFRARGVAEATAGEGLVLVRLARLFRWDEEEEGVLAALAGDQRAGGGIPGSTSGPV